MDHLRRECWRHIVDMHIHHSHFSHFFFVESVARNKTLTVILRCRKTITSLHSNQSNETNLFGNRIDIRERRKPKFTSIDKIW